MDPSPRQSVKGSHRQISLTRDKQNDTHTHIHTLIKHVEKKERKYHQSNMSGYDNSLTHFQSSNYLTDVLLKC